MKSSREGSRSEESWAGVVPLSLCPLGSVIIATPIFSMGPHEVLDTIYSQVTDVVPVKIHGLGSLTTVSHGDFPLPSHILQPRVETE